MNRHGNIRIYESDTIMRPLDNHLMGCFAILALIVITLFFLICVLFI